MAPLPPVFFVLSDDVEVTYGILIFIADRNHFFFRFGSKSFAFFFSLQAVEWCNPSDILMIRFLIDGGFFLSIVLLHPTPGPCSLAAESARWFREKAFNGFLQRGATAPHSSVT